MAMPHPITRASDRTLDEEGGDLTVLRCTTCGRVLTDADWIEHEQRWRCPGYAGDGILEEEAAALRLGPFAPRRPPLVWEPEPLSGFRWVRDPNGGARAGWYEALVWPPAEAERPTFSHRGPNLARPIVIVLLVLALAMVCR